MEEAYKNDFEIFMSHTDEKKILLEEITKEIQKIDAGSLLDIGAGNGELALPLSKKVEQYVAVESKTTFVSLLKEGGLRVIEGRFPVDVPGTFDVVLSSHSLSYTEENHRPFLSRAWELVSPQGILLLVSYRGEDDDWNKLLEYINEQQFDKNIHGYQSILSILESYGTVSIRKVITHVTTNKLEDMVNALSFVFGNGIPENKLQFLKHKSELEDYLSSKYLDQNKYSFPFQHFFISVQKS
ncbi:MAG: hypothetical protein RIQ41_62 [Candidatus Parcubacteria bacterium]|jgi:SAM-dependent methyltransferase